MRKLLQKFEAARPFTEAEAWMLFRLSAFAEAIGWTLLIIGILIERYTGNNTAVFITGNIHGTIYLAYFVAPLILYPSLGWSRWKALSAIIAGIPPYGSLLFEQWAAHKRSAHGFKSYGHYLLYNVLVTR
jgi:integral membrane protein